MKKLLMFTMFIFVLPVCSYTQAFGQNADFPLRYALFQNSPNPFENITTIKFKIKEDSYVKMYVINQQTGSQTFLVDGEMSAGKQGIVFSAAKRTNNRSETSAVYTCKMEVYSLKDNSLLYTSEIKMLQK